MPTWLSLLKTLNLIVQRLKPTLQKQGNKLILWPFAVWRLVVQLPLDLAQSLSHRAPFTKADRTRDNQDKDPTNGVTWISDWIVNESKSVFSFSFSMVTIFSCTLNVILPYSPHVMRGWKELGINYNGIWGKTLWTIIWDEKRLIFEIFWWHPVWEQNVQGHGQNRISKLLLTFNFGCNSRAKCFPDCIYDRYDHILDLTVEGNVFRIMHHPTKASTLQASVERCMSEF